jgi:hypothetical protein
MSHGKILVLGGDVFWRRVAGAGRPTMIDAPEEANGAIRTFLARVEDVDQIRPGYSEVPV